MFALVDCNNFYASCEKLFRPDLQHKPVVVLSNNDGCVVARSHEAKALGIKMGVPVFKIKPYLQRHNVQIFSSNFTLYADISDRVMRSLEALAPQVEVYSIDEAFLDLSGIEANQSLQEFGLHIKDHIKRCIGIHVCVGIAPTKTLAKLANHAAKTYPATHGVVDLSSPQRQRRLLALIPVEEVWGVGRRLAKQLQHQGIKTALDLSLIPPKLIRAQFSVVLERTVRELNGEACLALEELPNPKKQIVCSRSFGHKITELKHLREAVCEYTARATAKLRQEQRKAKLITVFIRTSVFTNAPHYSDSATGQLQHPSDDTRDFIRLAMALLQQSWQPNLQYAKAGVMLSDFYDRHVCQTDLFEQGQQLNNSELMAVIDRINQQGKGSVFFGGQGLNAGWTMKREHLSPAYTTRWDQLPRVK